MILAATAGALNVRLEAVVTPTQAQEPESAASLASRPMPELAHLGSTVGLVWRSVVMWMLLLALLTLARLIG